MRTFTKHTPNYRPSRWEWLTSTSTASANVKSWGNRVEDMFKILAEQSGLSLLHICYVQRPMRGKQSGPAVPRWSPACCKVSTATCQCWPYRKLSLKRLSRLFDGLLYSADGPCGTQWVDIGRKENSRRFKFLSVVQLAHGLWNYWGMALANIS